MAVRAGLGWLAATGFLLGCWAIVSPHGFYSDFPAFGSHWVSFDGPYNEHLVRDFGALNLALGVFTVLAAWWCSRPLVIAAALAWIVYSIPHVIYHGGNLDGLGTGDQVGLMVSLAALPVVAAVVLFLARALPRATDAHSDFGPDSG